MDYTDFRAFISWLDGMFQAEFGTPIDLHPVEVTQVEFNTDYPGLEFGGQSMTLRQFQNGFIRLYDKGDRTRFEVNVRDRLSLRDAATIISRALEEGPKDETLSRLQALQEQLCRLEEIQIAQIDVLEKIAGITKPIQKEDKPGGYA